MRRRLFFAAVGGLLVLASGLSAQEQGPLFLSITSPDGKRVEGITPQDVTITEDGAACTTTKVWTSTGPRSTAGARRQRPVEHEPHRSAARRLKGFFEQIPDGVEM